MKTSLKGILAIINEEALVLSTYRDAAGVLTIGVGHTASAGGQLHCLVRRDDVRGTPSHGFG